MTAAHTSERSSTGAARAAAIVTWIYAAGFGLSTVPVSIYLLKRGSLPSFLGLFDVRRPFSKAVWGGVGRYGARE